MAIDSYTKLLIHFDGADGATTHTAKTGQTVTFVGTAQLDTAQKKFGSAALLLDGDSDYVTVPDNANWNFASSPFTVDCWVRFTAVTGMSPLFCQITSGPTTYIYMDFDGRASSNKLEIYTYYSGATKLYITAPFAPVVDTWYHIAFVRVNTDNAATGWRIFIDGVAQTLTLAGGAWNAAMPDIASTLRIGTDDASVFHNGYIDEYRVLNGVARWTANFTPSNVPYKDTHRQSIIL